MGSDLVGEEPEGVPDDAMAVASELGLGVRGVRRERERGCDRSAPRD